MDRQKTSVFSDFESIDNSSFNSKQLENWLRNNSESMHSPKFGHQFPLTINPSVSRYLPDEVSFAKPQTFESINSQNNSLLSNKGNSNKSKSYVNAMQALQKRVKSLEQENQMMRRSLQRATEERSRSVSQSHLIEEELRSKIQILEPKTQKIEELIIQNKKLRETKEEKVRRVKTLQKINTEYKNKYDQALKDIENSKKQNEGLKNQLKKEKEKIHKLEQQVQSMFQKNKMLEELKEKSTSTLFEKYNKSLEFIQELEKENGKLKNQNDYLRKNFDLKIKETQQTYQSEIQTYKVQFEKLKESFHRQQMEIQTKIQEKQYFKQAYEKRDEEFSLLVKSHHQKQQKEENSKIKQSNESKGSSKSQIVQLPQTIIPKKKNHEDSSEIELDLDESMIPTPNQTKSVGKPAKRSMKKSSPGLSSSHKKEMKKKQQTTSLNTQQKKKKKIPRKEEDEENNSFVMKSCEPPTHKDYIFLSNEENPVIKSNYYYSSSGYPPIHNKNYSFSNYQEKNVEQFSSKKYDESKNLDKLMLIQIQKELLELYDEEQNLIMMSSEDNTTQNERAEYLGRMKQIHEQIRTKNEKACELKSKI